MMKRLAALLAISVATLGVVATPSADAAPYCGITWGSLAKSAGPSTSPFSPLTNVRAGRHACYDRMVFDLGGPASGYSVRYVTHVHTVATGDVLPLGGGARFEIVLRAPANDTSGNPTYAGVTGHRLPGVDLSGFRTFFIAKYGGSFEGLTIVGLSVRARLPFRVTKMGNRIVLDVAHQW